MFCVCLSYVSYINIKLYVQCMYGIHVAYRNTRLYVSVYACIHVSYRNINLYVSVYAWRTCILQKYQVVCSVYVWHTCIVSSQNIYSDASLVINTNTMLESLYDIISHVVGDMSIIYSHDRPGDKGVCLSSCLPLLCFGEWPTSRSFSQSVT